MEKKTVGAYLLEIIKWFDFERAMGIAFLFKCGLYAILPLRDDAIIDSLTRTLNLDGFMVGTWFLLSGLYLIKNGKNSSSQAFFLCCVPIFLTSFGSIAIKAINVSSTSLITFENIVSEITILILVFQRLIHKITSEIITKVNE